jgi:hypothetical protein
MSSVPTFASFFRTCMIMVEVSITGARGDDQRQFASDLARLGDALGFERGSSVGESIGAHRSSSTCSVKCRRPTGPLRRQPFEGGEHRRSAGLRHRFPGLNGPLSRHQAHTAQLLRATPCVFLGAEPAQWHWPFPLSSTSAFGAAVNSHVYACSVSCRRSTPWRPVILALLVGLGSRNL